MQELSDEDEEELPLNQLSAAEAAIARRNAAGIAAAIGVGAGSGRAPCPPVSSGRKGSGRRRRSRSKSCQAAHGQVLAVPRGCRARQIGRQMTTAEFIDIQAEYGTSRRQSERCHLLHGKGEAMRKFLAALAAVTALAVSVVAVPAPARMPTRYLYGPGYYYGPATTIRRRAITITARPAYVGRPRRPLLLATPALLGRFWLACAQRQGLRVSPFIFIKSRATPRETPVFPGRLRKWPEKTAFSGH